MATNNWPKQEWSPAEWEACSYYYIPFSMGYGGNNPETQEKEKQKGWEQIGEWPKTKYAYSADL